MKELLETGISTELGYSGKCDALVGNVKGLSVVIKENNATKSYGCLIWVKKKNSVNDDELYTYLSEQVAAKPHIIKHFKTTGRGAALALVKYNDPSRNMGNIDKFLGDLADDLYAHDYVNCCYACGATNGLAIYQDGGAVVQYCAGCARGTRVAAGDESEPESFYEEPAVEAAESLVTAPEAVEEAKSDDTEDSLKDLLADFSVSEPVEEEPVAHEIISSGSDNTDLSDFMLDETEAPAEEQPSMFISEPEHKETEPDSSLGQLMFSEDDVPADNSSEPAFGNANTYIDEEPSEEEIANFDRVMQDLNSMADDEFGSDADSDDVENANIYGLIIGSEQEIAEAGDVEVKVLATTEIGKGQEIQVTVQEEESVGDFGDLQVTEIVDDSNEGEDFQIEELQSDFNQPTDTKGGEIVASDTPLESDGSVPMVNPSSDYADIKPSSARDKNAVRAFAYGSYENANTAEEPVRFDGRPRNYKGTDPRLGDEVGSVSRDYSRQNAARTAPDAKPLKPTSFRVVSKADPAKMKPIDTKHVSYTSYGSNAPVGTLTALLFGVIGCALWCGIGYLLGLIGMASGTLREIIMAVFGFIPAFAVFFGYRIGGDCYDAKGIAISAIVSVIMDAVGLIAVLVAGDMQSKSIEYGYGIGIDKALENVFSNFSGSMLQIGITLGVMAIALAAKIAIAKKKG